MDSSEFIEHWQGWIDEAPDAHVFYYPAIFRAWTHTLRNLQHISPLCFVARLNGITFFLPLILWRRNWKNAFLRVIVPAGFPDFDYHDPIVSGHATQEDIDVFWALVEERLIAAKKIKYDELSLFGMRIPGKIRLSYLIREFINRNVRLFDFLKGAHAYKSERAKFDRQLFRNSRQSQGIDTLIKVAGYNSLMFLREFFELGVL
ncbi:MAG: hypothetical protein HGA70_00275 [Chlorobiaceae bacterium]|nr:hypothetical protein [Chlorobiaceae bacterium]